MRSIGHTISLQAYTTFSCTFGSAANWFDSNDLGLPFEIVDRHDEELVLLNKENLSPATLAGERNPKYESKVVDLSRLIASALRERASLWRRRSLHKLTELVELQPQADVPGIRKVLSRLYPQFQPSGLSLIGRSHYQIRSDILFLSTAGVYVSRQGNSALQIVISEMISLRDEIFNHVLVRKHT